MGFVQLDLFEDGFFNNRVEEAEEFPLQKLYPLEQWDTVIVYLSGGKDSIAALLAMLEMGFPKEKIECWHHEIDGREGSSLMDWFYVPDYCRKFCKALELPIYFSWREGGFEKELARVDAPTAATIFETPDGVVKKGGTSNCVGTRMRFPFPGGDLKTRYCSPYLKIMVAEVAIRNQDRFKGKQTLVISGERREESPKRSKYKEFELDRASSNSRIVYRYRPVLGWSEAQVWKIIERWRILPPIAYRLGWSRSSCFLCIFASDDQMASAYKVSPERVHYLAEWEVRCTPLNDKDGNPKSRYTIHEKKSVMERVRDGVPYNPMPLELIAAANSREHDLPIFLPQGQSWELPLGAFGKDKSGPV